MSQKWRRNHAWDRANLTGVLAPARWVLTTFSSITFAVVLLSFVALYGTLASMPIGLFALIPTQLFYGATALLTVALVVAPGQFIAVRVLPAQRVRRETRFVARLLLGLGCVAAGLWLWRAFAWPAIRYLPAVDATGMPASGVRFFPEFVEAYRSTLLRQLPSWEMTEIEFYAWWPLKLALLLFVTNMIVATVRRIEFKWLNVGVLTVHAGIVLIALGSIFYERGKVEGDTRLLKGVPAPKTWFYDTIRPALYVQRPDTGDWIITTFPRRLPRYNDAPAGSEYAPNLAVHAIPQVRENLPEGVEINAVGIVPYGEPVTTYVDGGVNANPSIELAVLGASKDDPSGELTPVWSKRLIGAMPGERALAAAHTEFFSAEHLVMPDARRVADLSRPFLQPGEHMLVVRVPDSGFEQAYVVKPGDTVAVGETGWCIAVNGHETAQQALELITEGYRGARSSRINLSLTGPGGKAFDRSVLHLYPERTQDFLPGEPGAPPRRVEPDQAIDITYIDASRMHFFLVQDDPEAGSFDVIQRVPGGGVEVFQDLKEGDGLIDDRDEHVSVRFVLRDFWPRTMPRVDIVPVPFERQEKQARGTYFYAYLDVEVKAKGADGSVMSERRWLPFNQYLDSDYEFRRVQRVALPDGGGALGLAFGRLRRELPDVGLVLRDFEMVPYPGTDTPRDYVSTLQVYSPHHPRGETHKTRLNRPYIYRRPFEWSAERNVMVNAFAWARSLALPEQYKFSQAGWDPQSQSFTVLGVGNNPGIYVIAVGGILMAAGIPWAFYVKPAIQRARKRKIQAELRGARAIAPESAPRLSGIAANGSPNGAPDRAAAVSASSSVSPRRAVARKAGSKR